MKKLITMFVLLIAVSSVRSNAYYAFPASNTMWTQREGNGDSTPFYYCYALLNQDTAINAVTYHLLFRSVDTIFTASECIGGLREDSMKRVYYYSFSTLQEKKLYDFSVQPGDTVDYNLNAATVDYIDSVNINGNYHRRVNFKTLNGNPWTAGAWIEGVGNSSLGGLLGPATAQPTCDCAANIICFRQNDTWQYHNSVYNTTDCLISMLDVAGLTGNDKPSVSIYPNPVTGSSRLHIVGLAQGNTLRIYTITGALLKSYTNTSDILISNAEYATGIYIYRLSDAGGNSLSGKFEVE
jgi:hypothetical protein